MNTIINKIIFGGLFIFLSWKGFDGLIINVLYGSLDTYDIFELEESKNFNSRQLEILNGIIYKEDFIYFESEPYAPVDIVYPLISHQQNERLYNGETITIKLLVRLNHQPWDCITTGDCLPPDSSLIRGMVKVGFENLNKDFKSLETDLAKLDPHIILLEMDEEPIVWYWNLFMFGVGSIFGFAILKSFFRKASSLSDYWAKITEKDALK